MRIDSSGNVGIGTSSVAGGRVQISGVTSDTDGTGLDQGQLLITDSDAATANGLMIGYRFNAGITEYGRIQCRNAVGATNLILQAGGGLVGIGTNNPGYKLDVAAAGTVSSRVYNTASNADAAFIAQNTVAQVAFGVNSTGQLLYNNAAIPTLFFNNGTEKMRIDASGNLLVGTTNSEGPGKICSVSTASGTACVSYRNSAGAGSTFAFFINDGNSAIIGSITNNANTGVLYNVTSDSRLKKNIADADNASSLIDALQVRKFDWKAGGEHQRYGFIAQELVEVAPEAVSQPVNPDDMMGVDYSKLVPMLIKEVQSLRARVAQLEGN
jgi:hypothetical protein